ncbi:hypothetical protein UFOVP1414_43 [uncultured Caudovirales phage]|uniref:Uncharacterized protein n=1 Tax=uncultured Caudovirales phage TaxID=2100421 RepID=A0A6J5SEQ9_9CAUD|nr:hypothetical protein UFOVP442_34 [uncultured Caudovirales phage]CAB4211895.1 hypothetical protein UFOVP1414_43 [uncultured Caudovirales phage]
MADATTPITRNLNRIFKGFCPKIKVSFVGSFMAVRIDDPEGVVSVKMATNVMRTAGSLLVEAGLVSQGTPNTLSYHMEGVVSNWMQRGA